LDKKRRWCQPRGNSPSKEKRFSLEARQGPPCQRFSGRGKNRRGVALITPLERGGNEPWGGAVAGYLNAEALRWERTME